jgi:phosphoglycerol transferase
LIKGHKSLSTYPITTLTAFWTMTRLNLSFLPSLLGAILFTFVPYHFFRGQLHLFLSAYYIVPLATLAILWIGQDKIGFRSKRFYFCLLVAIMLPCNGIYYAYFTLIFMAMAASFNLLTQKSYNFFIVIILAMVMCPLLMTMTLLSTETMVPCHHCPRGHGVRNEWTAI